MYLITDALYLCQMTSEIMEDIKKRLEFKNTAVKVQVSGPQTDKLTEQYDIAIFYLFVLCFGCFTS